jgi:hypothetical protein
MESHVPLHTSSTPSSLPGVECAHFTLITAQLPGSRLAFGASVARIYRQRDAGISPISSAIDMIPATQSRPRMHSNFQHLSHSKVRHDILCTFAPTRHLPRLPCRPIGLLPRSRGRPLSLAADIGERLQAALPVGVVSALPDWNGAIASRPPNAKTTLGR